MRGLSLCLLLLLLTGLLGKHSSHPERGWAPERFGSRSSTGILLVELLQMGLLLLPPLLLLLLLLQLQMRSLLLVLSQLHLLHRCYVPPFGGLLRLRLRLLVMQLAEYRCSSRVRDDIHITIAGAFSVKRSTQQNKY